MRIRLLLVSLVLAMGIGLAPHMAGAGTTTGVAVDASDIGLKKGKEGYSGSIPVVNTTDKPVTVTLSVAGDKVCTPAVDKSTGDSVAKHSSGSVSFMIPLGCEAVATHLTLDVDLKQAKTTVATAVITLKPPEATGLSAADRATIREDFKNGLALAVLLFMALIATLFVKSRGVIFSIVGGLDSKWSLTDSWATNLTGLTTAVVVLLGKSDSVTAIIGDDADKKIGAIVVSAGIAGILVAIAILTTKILSGRDGPLGLGVLIATCLTLAAVVAQILVIFDIAVTFASVPSDAMAHASDALVVLMLVYAYATVYRMLVAGPVAIEPVDAAEAAQLFCCGSDDGSPDSMDVVVARARALQTAIKAELKAAQDAANPAPKTAAPQQQQQQQVDDDIETADKVAIGKLPPPPPPPPPPAAAALTPGKARALRRVDSYSRRRSPIL